MPAQRNTPASIATAAKRHPRLTTLIPHLRHCQTCRKILPSRLDGLTGTQIAWRRPHNRRSSSRALAFRRQRAPRAFAATSPGPDEGFARRGRNKRWMELSLPLPRRAPRRGGSRGHSHARTGRSRHAGGVRA